MTEASANVIIAGTRQVIRAHREGRLSKVILACDVDDYIRRKITESCADVPIETGPPMAELGKCSDISVGTAVIGICKD